MAKKINEVLNNPLSFPFCSLLVMIRYLLMSIICILHSACPLPPPILHRLLFSNPLGRTVYCQKDINTIPYAKFAGQTECIMWDSKIVSGKEVSAHPSHLFLTILLYGAMEFFWPRTFESSGVENTPYVRACIRKTALWYISFECFLSFSSAKSAFSVWQSNQALVEAFQNVDHVVLNLKTLNRVHYLTNFRSTLLVMSRISCYEVAYARLSESRAAEKIK